METIQQYSPLSQKMATQAPLLACLIAYFKDPKPENVMTLALFHVLEKYPFLQRDLVSWIFREADPDQPSHGKLRMMAQVQPGPAAESGGDSRRIQPDVHFLDDMDGKSIVLMFENKFHAALTKNQPVRYLKALSRHRLSGLVLIVPRSEIECYRQQCHGLCKQAFPSRPLQDMENKASGYFCWDEDHRKFVYFLSWEDLINELCGQASKCSDSEQREVAQCDIAQLKGIQIKMVGEIIKPFKAEEFVALRQIADRIPQLYGILNKAISQLDEYRPPRGTRRWSSLTYNMRDTRHGITLYIRGWEFWLLPDFNELYKCDWKANESLPLFWLRIGFDWVPNRRTPEKKEQIWRAMLATNQTKRDDYDHFLMQLPFGMNQSEEDIISGLVETINTLDKNLGDLQNS
jgi:hypothetical protein